MNIVLFPTVVRYALAVACLASPDVPIAPYSGILEEYILPNPEKIAQGIRKLAAY